MLLLHRIGTGSPLKVGVAIHLFLAVIAVGWGVFYTVDGKNLKGLTEERVEHLATISNLKQQLTGVQQHAAFLETRLEALTWYFPDLE